MNERAAKFYRRVVRKAPGANAKQRHELYRACVDADTRATSHRARGKLRARARRVAEAVS